MRDAVLLLRRPLAERSAARRLSLRLEDRVVPEATRPSWRGRDPASQRAPTRGDAEAAGRTALARHREREHAHVSRSATLRRESVERGEQLRVVLLVRRVLPGVAPRAYSRGATECIDLDPGVIGD